MSMIKTKVTRLEESESIYVQNGWTRLGNIFCEGPEGDFYLGNFQLHFFNDPSPVVIITIYKFGERMINLSRVLNGIPAMHSYEIDNFVRYAFDSAGLEIEKIDNSPVLC